MRGGRGGGGGGGGGGGAWMLGHLVSMRDEEVLHAVHGRICLCWCFTFVSFLGRMFFPGEEGRSVAKAFSSSSFPSSSSCSLHAAAGSLAQQRS